MFFPHVFADTIPSVLPATMIFLVEEQTVQILTEGDTKYLEKVVRDNCLTEAIMNELQFFGQIPEYLQKDAKADLAAQICSLTAAAQEMIRLPDDQEVRSQFCTHSAAPDE